MSVKNEKKVKDSEAKALKKEKKRKASEDASEILPKIKKSKKESPKKDENASPNKEKKAKFEKPTEPKKKVDKKKAKLSEKITKKKDELKSKLQKKEKKELNAEEKAELKEKKKKLREERRKKDRKEGVFDIGIRAKQVWEEVRREDCKPERKEELLNELHQLVKGNIAKIIYAHDTVRVVECLVALGDEKIRDALFEEMKDDLINMAKSKYASFFVQKMVKYGNKVQRDTIFKALEGRVSDLTKHKIANALVEACYNEYCNAAQRNRFLQEFFGPEFRHFKEPELRTVIQVMMKYPDKRRDILKHLASNVSPLITKGCYNHSLVHTVLYNYMIGLNHQMEAMPSEKERREKERSDFISALKDVYVHIVHSHDGSRLTMNSIWHGTAKDRKGILKNFKSYMVKTAQEEHGYMTILSMLDSIDDTKLTTKSILGELVANDEVLEEILGNERSRKVLTFGLVGRNKTYFHPDVLANLSQGDGNANSKKDADIRQKEVSGFLIDPLCNYAEKNIDKFLSDNQMTLFLGALVQACPEDNAAGNQNFPILTYFS